MYCNNCLDSICTQHIIPPDYAALDPLLSKIITEFSILSAKIDILTNPTSNETSEFPKLTYAHDIKNKTTVQCTIDYPFHTYCIIKTTLPQPKRTATIEHISKDNLTYDNINKLIKDLNINHNTVAQARFNNFK